MDQQAEGPRVPVQIMQGLHKLLGDGLHHCLGQLGVFGQKLEQVACESSDMLIRS